MTTSSRGLSLTFFMKHSKVDLLPAQELLQDIKSLAEEKPTLAQTYTIGNSVLGQPLQVSLKSLGSMKRFLVLGD